MQLGVFIPTGNNDRLTFTKPPRCKLGFDLSPATMGRAERLGLALLHGSRGAWQFRNRELESSTPVAVTRCRDMGRIAA